MKYNMISWNFNGIRAIYKKVFSEQHQKKKNYTEQFNLNATAKPEHVLIREVITSE